MENQREVVEAFCDECVWVRSIRTHFADLFETNTDRTALLSDVANIFFHDINLILIEYILLQQCKLTDPASSGKDKNNLTTNFIWSMDWSEETGKILRSKNTELMKFQKLIIDARHKLVSHLDLKSRLQSIGLGNFSKEDEANFWRALQEFINAAHAEMIGGPYDINAAMQEGDVASLIHALRDAVDYDQLVENEDGFLLRRINQRRYENA